MFLDVIRGITETLGVLFCIHWSIGIDGTSGRVTLPMKSDREPLIPELPPSHYKTVELIIGENSDYPEAWASTLHEMGHMFSHPHKIGNGRPREKFLMEVEAWNFAKSHWGQAPPEKPFPNEFAKEMLESYYLNGVLM